ncbi:DUF1289 domain-containing protein [Oceaniglobus trochenteri]|uniref:DUF1289 domain-containing protein n=1 Tax=Oceaniglobus trochenteri TaxID=2763260 RepID=UPI001CFFD57D|nr:DUF1289 domain-containing protein [Oceaniglobus trochenteri]
MSDDGKASDDDIVWSRAETDSPCVKICVVHPAERLCTGCLRTLDEIAQWSRLDAAQRRQILAELPGRAGQLKQRRGGRAARLARSQG